ncbi:MULTISPECIES: 1-phosphofructokinase family hexose kinase [unclassified Bartonella]|uniref:1-phosphofructokinase family hexose kinase n=1 Tax=unclassified Bartonella TaxID=2645622 RepID=UPI0015FE17B9|nr:MULTISPECIES: 1-phosphofructokinase family hexose kinase [unclassified Bartonella]UXN02343.1 1-phosphofructokinase family hexose kinase [Bartonella sp. HY406]
MANVLTVTFNPTVDAASEVDRVQPTHKVRTRDESFHPGGGGINVARVIHRLGGSVKALYARGGVMGSVLDQLLAKRGVDAHIIQIASNTRINNVIYETSTGMEYRFIAEGPIFTEDDWKAVVDSVKSASWHWLVVSGSLPRGVPMDVYDEMIAIARQRGGEIVIDTSGPALRHVLDLGGLTLIKPSQGEFENAMGREFRTVADLAEAAHKLVCQKKSQIIAVTLGHQGAVLAMNDKTLYLPSPPVKVISASGAGDSFIGGMVHALAHGQSIEDAFRLGVACGSAAVMEKGTGLCQLQNIEELFQYLTPSDGAFAVLPIDPE